MSAKIKKHSKYRGTVLPPLPHFFFLKAKSILIRRVPFISRIFRVYIHMNTPHISECFTFLFNRPQLADHSSHYYTGSLRCTVTCSLDCPHITHITTIWHNDMTHMTDCHDIITLIHNNYCMTSCHSVVWQYDIFTTLIILHSYTTQIRYSFDNINVTNKNYIIKLTTNKYQIKKTINILTNNHYNIKTLNNKIIILSQYQTNKIIKLLNFNNILYKINN